MENSHHTMPELFDQLGLPSDRAAIKAFIATHRPLADDVVLADAPFWTASQAALIKEKLREDGDWALLVDHLSAALREHPDPSDLPSADADAALQGEGNYAAGKRYDDAAQAFAQSGRVAQAARDAAPRNPQEAQQMRQAERVGRSKART